MYHWGVGRIFMSHEQDHTSSNTSDSGNDTNSNTNSDSASNNPADERRFIDKHFGTMMASVIVLTIVVNAAIWFAPRGFFGGMMNQMPEQMPHQMMTPNQTPPASNQVPSSSPSAQPTSELLALGEQRFEQVCANCHGVNGQGYVAAGAPPLNGSAHAWHHSDTQIRGWLRGGYNAMPAVPSNWTDRDIDAVLAYVKQWWTPDQQAFHAGL